MYPDMIPLLKGSSIRGGSAKSSVGWDHSNENSLKSITKLQDSFHGFTILHVWPMNLFLQRRGTHSIKLYFGI